MALKVGDRVVANGLVDGRKVEGVGKVVRIDGMAPTFYLVSWEVRRPFMYNDWDDDDELHENCWGGHEESLYHATCENE